MKNILGLDLGTNSIGWALVQTDDEGNYQSDIHLGSRIIPMTQDVLSNFDSGAPIETQTAVRTRYRGVRRLYERRALRRERLLRVLHTLRFLPEHFDTALGWDKNDGKTYGKFLDVAAEPKLPWNKDATGKMQFLFKESFAEMLADFEKAQPVLVASGKKVPYDWTLYYLRDKALTRAITKEELAWILLNFNQKRGYYQLRGKDEIAEEDPAKREEYIEQEVVDVEPDPTDKTSAKGIWYSVILANGMVYRRQSTEDLSNWVGLRKEFVVTTKLNPDGTEKKDKDGNIARSFRAPKADDWTLRKVKTEDGVKKSGLTVGSYIYKHLLEDPSDKIIGKYVETIDRKYYIEELKQILSKQQEFIPELSNKELLKACCAELYARNEAHRTNIEQKDFISLFIEDILFYQRPLKSKKSLISDCPYESYKYVNKETGEEVTQPVKCAAKSNPYFQEYRIRQFIQNLHLYEDTGLGDNDITEKLLPNVEERQRLYLWLRDRDKIKQDTLLKDFFELKKPKGKESKYPYRWNYPEDKEYPMGTTRSIILKGLDKAKVQHTLIDDPEVEYRLWHLLYSIMDVTELQGALHKFADIYGLDADSFVKYMADLKTFEEGYGSYSEKALKKLLSKMRSGMNTHEACYEVYGRYSEGMNVQKWNSPEELKTYIAKFQQHSLRNPIVEQCILETLRTVCDIWQQYGHIDEVHVEVGREMKNPANQRQRIFEQNQRNENTNLRIKALLQELLNDKVADVRPNSPMQQDILRIYEEGALMELKSGDADFDEIKKISTLANPTSAQIKRYKLWLEQKYRSPYTGKVIPLAKLFTPAYQIEHVIPRARYYDDSFNNKVICEAEVNKEKSDSLAYEFICAKGGSIIQTVNGPVTVFKKGEYEQFVKDHYSANKRKMAQLLMDDIPAEFISRQMNDSRYISKVIKSLLSNIVREADEDQDMSKHVIVCTGSVTDRLKKDWGMHDVWNHIVYPRYERLNELTGTEQFGHWENKQGKRVFQTSMPLELQRGYSKKRIDHRHHAMDALVIACTSSQMVNLLSNLNASEKVLRLDLKHKLCGKGGEFKKPWETFTQDAEKALSEVVVSFKNKVRVLSRATNIYEKYDNNGKKCKFEQTGENRFAVRKPLHKETIYGAVNLQRTKEVSLNAALDKPARIVDAALRQDVQNLFRQGLNKAKVKKQLTENGVKDKVEVRYFTNETEPLVAVRKNLDDSFDEKRIKTITDTGIQKILLSYLASKGGDPKNAFCPEGIAELNENISNYNNGKHHQPIIKVRVTEPKGEKFVIGETGHKTCKYAEAQSGTNLYFAIYCSKDGSRTYSTIPLNIVVERLKQGLSPAPEFDESNNKLLFTLSPNDLVYVPNEDEITNIFNDSDFESSRIYKFVDGSGTTANFIPYSAASLLYKVNKEDIHKHCTNKSSIQNEFGIGSPQSKNQKSLDGQMIKAVCWKLEVDRLGNITKVIR